MLCMDRKIRITSLKNLDFGIVDFKQEMVRDPDSKKSAWQQLPKFDIIRPQINSKKLSGNMNGQPFIITKSMYTFREKDVRDTHFFETGEPLTWEEAMKLLFNDTFLKQKFTSNTAYIELLINDNSDKETVKWLLDEKLIEPEWINNTQEYVEAKEGIVQNKALHYIAEDAKPQTPNKSENESNPAKVAVSPAMQEFQKAIGTDTTVNNEQVPLTDEALEETALALSNSTEEPDEDLEE